MDKKVKENMVYVLEKNWSRFRKPLLLGLCVSFVWAGASFAFHKVDKTLSAVEIQGYNAQENNTAQEETLISKESILFIPVLHVEAPIAYVQSTNAQDFQEPLRNGVTHYPSAMPGETGISVILGHSAPFGILNKGFDGVFSNINDLEPGDEILVQYKGNVHTYIVEGQQVIKRGQEIPQDTAAAAQSKLVLLSCWPPGIDNKRIMVQATAL